MDLKKVEGVQNWPRPKKVKEVQAFLGFANFYRRFVKDFAKIATPLNRLTRKDQECKWGEDEDLAFNDLKERFTSEPILHYPDPVKPLRVEADSSGFATGGVLSVLEDDQKWYPCTFISKFINEVERNNEIYDREKLSIMRCLEDWHHYLEGAKKRFEILSDHKNLQYFLTSKKLNRWQVRWCLFLSRFDFLMTYRKGALSTKVDLLSRRSDHDQGENDNENIILLKPEYFRIAALSQGHILINTEETPLLSEIRKSKNYDESIVKAIEDLKKSSTKHLRSDEWQLKQDLILFQGKVYVFKDDNLRCKVIELHHNSLSAGHPGQWKTIKLITRNYWWPGLSIFTIEYVIGCDTGNRTKMFPEKPVGKLLPLSISNAPWKSISSDMIVSLPECQGCNTILVVADRFTKEAHFIPCTNETSTRGLATLFRNNIWKLHGLPDDI